MQALLEKLRQTDSKTIFLSGKTCTGKTTFAKQIEAELGYSAVELDQLVVESVANSNPDVPIGDIFVSVYRGGTELRWREQFVEAVRQKIAEHPQGLVLEGALAHNETLAAIFTDQDFTFLHLHPTNLEQYIGRLTERFIAGVRTETTGLPKHFWRLVNDQDITEYLETNILNPSLAKTIADFAKLSQQESIERYEYFRASFPHIEKVEI